MSVADKVTTGTYNFVSLIEKMLLALALSLTLSLPFTDKTQYFLHLSFNSVLQLFNYILGDLQKLLRYFNGTAIVFFRMPLAWFGASGALVFPNDLVLYLKDLKLLVLVA